MQKSRVGGHPILIVGTRETSNKYVEELKKAGLNAHGYGVLEVKPLIDESKLEELDGFDFDIVIFTSKNAVRLLLSSSSSIKTKISKCRVYAIGEGTKSELELHGLDNVEVPLRESSMGLLEELQKEDLKGKVVGIFHSTKVNEELIRRLKELGAVVHSFPLYDIVVDLDETRRLLEDLKRYTSAPVVFLAKTAFQALINLDAQAISILKDRMVIALGEMVSKALELYEIPHHVLQKPSVSSIIAMVKSLQRRI